MNKTIPEAQYIDMANDNDIYSVGFDREWAQEWAEDGVFITKFDDWLKYCGDVRLSGYGRNSGRKLWQVSREIQRQAYRICKENSVSINQDEVTQ